MRRLNRRSILLVPVALGTVGLGLAFAQSTLKKVEETEPKATAIGYRHDSTKVDQARYPKHDAAQKCQNCLAWAPEKPTDEWGECDLMSDRMVNRNGWCSSYKKQKKAG
jgi:High potential iron-sulfur protein